MIRHPAHPDASAGLFGAVVWFGGESSSSSSNETRNTTNQVDRRIGATDQAVVFAPESGSPISVNIDSENALGVVENVAQGARAFAESIAALAFGQVDKATDRSFALVEEAKTEGKAARWRDLALIAAIIAVAYFARK